MILWVYF